MSNQTIESKVEINRVCTLQPGDCFLYDGYWRTVVSLTKEGIRFKSAFGECNIKVLGKKSQLFVQTARNPKRKKEEEEE